MRERNRGARRDRTRHLIRRRSEWRVREAIRQIEIDSCSYTWPYRPDGNGRWGWLHGFVPGSEATAAQIRDIHCYYRRHEGRVSLRDDSCIDCGGHFFCEWCHGGTLRKQYRSLCRLNDDKAEWEREFYGMKGFTPSSPPADATTLSP